MIKTPFRPRRSWWTHFVQLGRSTVLTLRCLFSEETAARVLFEAETGQDIDINPSGSRHLRS